MEYLSAATIIRPCPWPRRGTIVASYPSCIQLSRVSCKRWRCPTCGPRNARVLRRRMEQVHVNRMLTLTYRMAEGQSQTDALRAIRKAWVEMRKQMARKLGLKSITYVLVIEWTKKGAPHIHALLSTQYLAQRWLSTRWRRLTGSPIVDIRRIRSSKSAAGYLTSYLTKEQTMPKGQHKYSASRGTLPPAPPREYGPDEEQPTYTYVPDSIDDELSEWEKAGASTARLSDDTILIFETAPGRRQERASQKPRKRA